jgi:hypothetical protein
MRMLYDNFYITNRIDREDTYVLWYLPNYECINVQHLVKLLNILKDLSIDVHNISNYIKIINSNNQIITFINSYTNFWDIHKNANMIYNVRHLNMEHKEKISLIIDTFLNFKYLNKFNSFDDSGGNNFTKRKMYGDLFFNIYNNKYYVFTHYPNGSRYNIFHMHIINSSDTKYFLEPDLYGSHIESSHKRLFFWDQIKNNILLDKNIVINGKIIYKDLLKKNTQYTKLIKDDNYVTFKIKHSNE